MLEYHTPIFDYYRVHAESMNRSISRILVSGDNLLSVRDILCEESMLVLLMCELREIYLMMIYKFLTIFISFFIY